MAYKLPPGPWKIANHQEANHFVINGPDRWVMVVQFNGELPTYVQEANMRAITALPELIDALNGMLEWSRRVKVHNPGLEIRNAIVALEKAEQI